MSDERCRVTVVGERRRVDLALPARSPISEYAPRLAELCGQEESEAMPPVWSLAPAAGPPMAVGDSLEHSGVVDGDVLYLRDCHADEDLDVTVTDLDDQVAAVHEHKARWNARNRAHSLIVLGLLTSVLAAVALSLGRQTSPAFVMFFLVGLGSALTAWYAARKSWPVPGPVRQVLALAACPLLVCAGFTAPLHGSVTTPVLVSAAAAVGALAGLLALPAVSTVVTQLVTAVNLALVVPLTLLDADWVQSAAVVGTVLLLLLRVLPRVAGQVSVVVPRSGDERDQREDTEVPDLVRRGDRLLSFLTVLVSTVLGCSLVALSTSRSAFALGLLGCLSVALLLDASSARLLTVVGPQLAAGTLGLTALAVRAPDHFADALTVGVVSAFAVGVLMTGYGLVLAFRAAVQTVDLSERPKWLTGLATFLAMVSLPLAVGVFGVFGTLANLGESL